MIEEIKKNLRTWVQEPLVFEMSRLEGGVTNLYFLQDKYLAKNFYTTL